MGVLRLNFWLSSATFEGLINLQNMKNLNERESKLYALCCEYGGKARHWRDKFVGLLPEVAKLELYKKLGFLSVFEFAAKLAGVSHDQVRLVLNLEQRFEDKPLLHEVLVEGEVSLSKLARVVSVATVENESALVAHLKVLPRAAVETMVRDLKMAGNDAHSLPSGLPGQTLTLSEEVTQKLLELQTKGLDVNDLLLEFLEKRERDIEDEKTAVAFECEETSSRYIPVKVRNVVEKEHGDKCSMPHCSRPSENLHHTQRFSLVQRHDPHFIAPLCKNHHTLAHAVDVSVQEKRQMALQPSRFE